MTIVYTIESLNKKSIDFISLICKNEKDQFTFESDSIDRILEVMEDIYLMTKMKPTSSLGFLDQPIEVMGRYYRKHNFLGEKILSRDTRYMIKNSSLSMGGAGI